MHRTADSDRAAREVDAEHGLPTKEISGSRLARPRWRRYLRWWTSRPSLAAAVIYAVLALVFVGPGLVPGRTLSSSDYLWSSAPWTAEKPPGVRLGGTNFELADTVAQFQPFLRANRASFPGVQLWNPYLMGGRPFLGNAQSGVFSPFTLPADVLPFWRSLALIAALKLFAAAFGTFLLARGLGMRFGGSLLAGTVYAFGLFSVAWLQWPLGSVFVLIPLVLAATDRVVSRPDALSAAALAAIVALQFFAGHPESSFYGLAAAVIFFGLRLLRTRNAGGREPRQLLHCTGVFAGAVALGTAVAAVMLLPFVELLTHSADLNNRAGLPPVKADSSGLSALFFPDRWGRPTHFELRQFLINRAYFAGTLTLMLGGAALLIRPTRRRLWTAAAAVLALVTAFGVPPLFTLLTHLPLVRSIRLDRLGILFLLGVALLGGWGLDEVSDSRRAMGQRRRLVLALGCAIAVLPALWLVARNHIALGDLRHALHVAWRFGGPPLGVDGLPTPQTASVLTLATLLEWTPLALVGVGLLAWGLHPRRPLAPAMFVTLATGLTVVELFRAGMGYNPAIPVSHAVQPTTGAIRYLQEQRPSRFVGLNPTGSDVTPLNGDVAMRYGLYDARGYDWPVVTRYDRLWRRTVSNDPFLPPTTRATANPVALRGLNLLSVSNLLQDPNDRALAPLPGLRLAYAGRDARIYQNSRALPRAFMVDRQRVVPGESSQLAAVTAPGFNGRDVAITDRPVSGLARVALAPSSGSAGDARLTSYGSERAVATVDTPRGGMLVLTDVYYPGWTASVDSKPTAIHRVDYLLRGVVIPAGRHRVTFTYQPTSFTVGWIISVISLIVLGGIALVGHRRRRSVSGRWVP